MLYDPERPSDPDTPSRRRRSTPRRCGSSRRSGSTSCTSRARELLAEAGAEGRGRPRVLDRAFVMEQVAKAPRTFTLHARNAANTVEVGGGTPLWMNVGGPPFFSRSRRGPPRRLAGGARHDHQADAGGDPLNCAQTGASRPSRCRCTPGTSTWSTPTIRWSDLPYTTYGTSGPRARDGIEMARDPARRRPRRTAPC